jgi:cobalt-zinc-cadmium efflux system outer membrane protein
MKRARQTAITGIAIGAAVWIVGCASAVQSGADVQGGIDTRLLGKDVKVHATLAGPAEDGGQKRREPTGELSRSEALDLVLLHNPELRSFSWDIRIAAARKLQAGLWPNPELEIEVEDIGGTGERSGFDGAETTVVISQPIELGDKRAKRVHLADAHSRLAEWDYEAKRLEVYAQVSKSFSRVLAAQERVRLAETQVELAEKLSLAVAKRVEAGKDSPVEKTKAQIELSNSRIELTKASAELEVAKRQLASLWAADKPEFAKATGQLDDIVEPGSYETLRELTLKHPSVARWDDEVAAGKAASVLADAQRFPDISVVGGLKRFEEANENTVVLGLAIPLPVFDRNQAGRLEATYALAKARELVSQARSQTLARLAEAHGRLVDAGHQASILRGEILPNAEQVFNATLTGYEQGKFDYLTMLDSQRTLFDVRQRAVAALLEYHQARADVESLIGQRLPVADEDYLSNAAQKPLLQESTDER